MRFTPFLLMAMRRDSGNLGSVVCYTEWQGEKVHMPLTTHAHKIHTCTDIVIVLELPELVNTKCTDITIINASFLKHLQSMQKTFYPLFFFGNCPDSR